MGLQLGYSGFPCDQNKCDLSGAYATYINFGLNVEDIYARKATHQRMHVRKIWGRILFAFVSTCIAGKYLNTSNGRAMDDDAITWGSVGGLVSPV